MTPDHESPTVDLAQTPLDSALRLILAQMPVIAQSLFTAPDPARILLEGRR